MEQFAVASPLGPLALTLDGDAVTRLEFPRSPRTGTSAMAAGDGPRSAAGERVARALSAYFDAVELPALMLRPGGTAFQQRVWEALRAVPAGETATYGVDVKHRDLKIDATQVTRWRPLGDIEKLQ